MARLTPFLLVGLGGFLGCVLRYAIHLWAVGHLGTRFPYATFFINVVGSFVLGMIGALATEGIVDRPEEVRLLMGTGFCGGFTTFSSYELENDLLLRNGQILSAAINFCLSPVLGFIAVRIGSIFALAWRG